MIPGLDSVDIPVRLRAEGPGAPAAFRAGAPPPSPAVDRNRPGVARLPDLLGAAAGGAGQRPAQHAAPPQGERGALGRSRGSWSRPPHREPAGPGGLRLEALGTDPRGTVRFRGAQGS